MAEKLIRFFMKNDEFRELCLDNQSKKFSTLKNTVRKRQENILFSFYRNAK